MQASVSYDSDTGASSNPLYTTTYTANALGQVTGAGVSDGLAKTIAYTLDANGQIIRRVETRNSAPAAPAPRELFYRFGGKQNFTEAH